MPFPKKLDNTIWHTTSIERFASILADGYIYPNPNIPDKERWGTHQGKSHYPFTRTLNGVSLFEFSQFNPNKYSDEYPCSSWYTFIPHRRDWKSSIWIEIDISKIKGNYIYAQDLLQKWKQEKAYDHPIMPMIEAAYIGALSTQNFRKILISTEAEPELKPYSNQQP